MFGRLIRELASMLSYLVSDFSDWLSSPKMFSDWYRLLMYRIVYLLKKDSTTVFTLHARNGIKFKARMEDFVPIFGCWLSNEYFPTERYTLPDKATVVDIGASIGLFTLYVASKYPGSRIFSYEPGKRSFEFLLDNVHMNNLEKKVTVHSIAVSSNRGKRTFYVPKGDIQSSFFMKSDKLTTVKTITLEDILAEVGKIDFLKVDAEGAEYEILLGAKRDTLRKITTVSLEYHDYITDHNHSEILEMFKNNGYSTKILLKHRSKITGIIFATRQDAE